MFSGIIEEMGVLGESRLQREPKQLVFECQKVLEDLNIGASIAVNGVCLTVEHFGDSSFTVGVMPETLRRTNLGVLRPGDRVNLERSLGFGDRIGGHLVQGHVDATGVVLEHCPDGAALIVKIGVAPEVARYIVKKGFVAVDGVSLTVMDAHRDYFTVSLVYHTQQAITLPSRLSGERVNIETDVVAKYVERFVAGYTPTAPCGDEQGHDVNAGERESDATNQHR